MPRGAGVKTVENALQNRVYRDGEYEYTYDDEGRRIKRAKLVSGSPTVEREEYSYDVRGRQVLAKIYNASGIKTFEVAYEFDAFDRRTARIESTFSGGAVTGVTVERFVYDGTDVILDLRGTGTTLALAEANLAVKTRYLWADHMRPGETSLLLAQENVTAAPVVAEVLWAFIDHQSTVRDLVRLNFSGGVYSLYASAHYQFDSFGRFFTGKENGVTITAPTLTRILFTGQEFDRISKNYLHTFRIYEPNSARWNKDDPISFASGQWNLTIRTGNDPVNYTDPSGLAPQLPQRDPNDSEALHVLRQIDPDVYVWFKKHGEVRYRNASGWLTILRFNEHVFTENTGLKGESDQYRFIIELDECQYINNQFAVAEQIIRYARQPSVSTWTSEFAKYDAPRQGMEAEEYKLYKDGAFQLSAEHAAALSRSYVEGLVSLNPVGDIIQTGAQIIDDVQNNNLGWHTFLGASSITGLGFIAYGANKSIKIAGARLEALKKAFGTLDTAGRKKLKEALRNALNEAHYDKIVKDCVEKAKAIPEIRVGKWGGGSFGSAADSLKAHFAKHGAGVGAKDIDQYLRKAEGFAQNLKGATKSSVEGATESVTRYKKLGKYIDIDREGNIISFGMQ